MSDVTRLLDAARAGDRQAATDLLPLVYDEPRRLAAVRMAAESPAHTLNPTALVHETYLRLVGDQQFNGRGHFFAAAAEAMRRILVDAARNALKRGGTAGREALDPDRIQAPGPDDELLALDEALEQLAVAHPEHTPLVKMRYFAGLTADDAATALGISPSTADRRWTFARAWLKRAMQK